MRQKSNSLDFDLGTQYKETEYYSGEKKTEKHGPRRPESPPQSPAKPTYTVKKREIFGKFHLNFQMIIFKPKIPPNRSHLCPERKFSKGKTKPFLLELNLFPLS